jgi:hypothetical protein
MTLPAPHPCKAGQALAPLRLHSLLRNQLVLLGSRTFQNSTLKVALPAVQSPAPGIKRQVIKSGLLCVFREPLKVLSDLADAFQGLLKELDP